MSSIEYINSVVLTSEQSSVIFSDIPSNYNDFIIISVASSDYTSWTEMRCRFNSSTALEYSNTILKGNGSAASSTRNSTGSSAGRLGYLTNSATDFSVFNIHSMSYASSSTFKTFLSESGSSSGEVWSMVSLWGNISAVSSVDLLPGAGSFRSGSTFTLWGVK